MNRGKDRRETLTSLPRIPCLVDAKIIARTQSTRARVHFIVDNAHSRKKREQTLDHLTFANRKRENDVLCIKE